jgi:hypothetical protein
LGKGLTELLIGNRDAMWNCCRQQRTSNRGQGLADRHMYQTAARSLIMSIDAFNNPVVDLESLSNSQWDQFLLEKYNITAETKKDEPQIPRRPCCGPK